MTKTKPKSKVPTRRYPSDDLVVENAGQSYKPHEGEWVEMRGGPSWSFLADSATIGRLEAVDRSKLSAGESQEMSAAINRVTSFIASRVVGWTWTDADGEPLPPPSVETIGQLEHEEVFWLISCLTSSATPSEQESETKNV